MIDFAAVAARFGASFAAQTHGWPTLFDHLDKLVEKLDDASRDAERATRIYPLLRWRNEAIGVHATLVGGLLLPAPARGPGLTETVGTAVTSETSLLTTVGAVEGMLAAIDAALARYDRAGPELFDRPGRGSDLFGIAGLAWRGALGRQNQEQILGAARTVPAAAALLRNAFPAKPSTSSTSPPSAGLSQTLTEVAGTTATAAELTMDAVLVVPLAGLALSAALVEGPRDAKVTLLEALVPVQSEVAQFHAAVAGGLLAAIGAGNTAQLYMSAADVVLALQAAYLHLLLPSWISGLTSGVTGLLDGITAWGRWTGSAANAVAAATDDLLAVDLVPWILSNTVGSWATHLPLLPSITPDDLVEAAMGDHDRLRSKIDRLLWVLDHALTLVDTVPMSSPTVAHLHQVIDDLRQISDLALTATPFPYLPDVLPTGPLAGFPNVYDAVFGGGARARLIGSVGNLGRVLAGSTHDLLESGSLVALGLAGTADTQARRQARAGAGLQLGRRWRQEGALVGEVFGPLARDAVGVGGGPDAMADWFAREYPHLVAVAGVAAASSAVPAFVGELQSWLRARRAGRSHPTSAHVLARHGRLAGVHLPRLTVRAPGRSEDPTVPGRAADAFRDTVLGAYREGRRLVPVAAGGTPGGGGRG